MNITTARTILRKYGYGARKLTNLPGCYNITWNGRVWFTIDITTLDVQGLEARIEKERPNITLENCL